MLKGYEALEITTRIGCPNNCLLYCPQEVLKAAYPKLSPKLLSFSTFKKCLESVPSDVDIDFSGFGEPFSNPMCTRMMQYASDHGHRLALYTTLVGATEDDLRQISGLKYRTVVLHIPDGKVFKMCVTPEYMRLVGLANRFLPVTDIMSMGCSFESNNRENIVRGVCTTGHAVTYCVKHEFPQFELLPNGDVYLCCMDFGLWHKLGNLRLEPYIEVRTRYLNNHKNYRLCSLCSWNGALPKSAIVNANG